MCGSDVSCKAVRQKIQFFSLGEHEAQLNKCYACLHSQAPRVSRSVASKTDKAVRFSFVEKHYQAISQIQKA
ncbi:MAG: hypothetical protein J7J31_00180 [Helicobacteraceae bacterium]|nr:hypothetical protein [Helicobacteraceae bacterium]